MKNENWNADGSIKTHRAKHVEEFFKEWQGLDEFMQDSGKGFVQ
jgi:hypothetical protein